MSRPLISYVITAYNIEDYIKQSIECAFSQTYTPLEIILSDDCSSDRTFEIMQEMVSKYDGPHKIKLNRNEENLGITRHMNKAYLELTRGEIIVAAHGDDISIPERTQISYDFLKSNPSVTAVSLSLKSIDNNGIIIGTDDACVDKIRYYNFLSGGNIPAPSRTFYKKVFSTFGPLDDTCPTEDELITTRALMLGDNAFLPEVGVLYRKHSGSSSNPENFSKFPLERIFDQQIKDISKGVELGLITQDVASKRIIDLRKGLILRKSYRAYFAHPSIWSLIKLVLFSKYNLRSKAHFIIDHFRRFGK